MIKYIVSDMDGTLFAGHGDTVFDLSDRNRAALEKAREAGMGFCVASGRMIEYGIRLLTMYGFPKICCAGFNGGVCYDDGEIVVSLPLDMELLRRAVEVVEEEFPQYQVIQIQGLNSVRVFTDKDGSVADRYRRECARLGIARVADFTVDEFLSDPRDVIPGKLSFIMNSREECEAVRERLRQVLGDTCFITFSDTRLMEVCPREAGKNVFVRYLREAYGLKKEEIAVIGDALNDAEMYSEAGLCFAMASGEPAVKEMADVVVSDVAECIEECLRRNAAEAGASE